MPTDAGASMAIAAGQPPHAQPQHAQQDDHSKEATACTAN